jgi:hypothetical protein
VTVEQPSRPPVTAPQSAKTDAVKAVTPEGTPVDPRPKEELAEVGLRPTVDKAGDDGQPSEPVGPGRIEAEEAGQTHQSVSQDLLSFTFDKPEVLVAFKAIDGDWRISDGRLTSSGGGLTRRLELDRDLSGDFEVTYSGSTNADMGISIVDS